MKPPPIPLGDNPNLDKYIQSIAELKLPQMLRVGQVAELLNLDSRRVYELVANGDLAAIRSGSRGIRIFRDSLIDWMREGGCGP